MRQLDIRVLAVVCFLLSSGALPLVAQGATASTGAEVRNLTYSGSGDVPVEGGELMLWQSSAHEFSATVSTDAPLEAELCLRTDGRSTDRFLTCDPVSLPGNATESASISVQPWPANVTGSQNVSIHLRSANESATIVSEPLSLTVINKSGDVDDDGLANEREVSLGTDLRTLDTDDDGLEDGPEVHTHETAPTNPDTDDDGLEDGAEVETHGTNPTVADSDDDGLPDGAEVNTYGTDPTNPDTDGDGLDDGLEVNTYETDPTVADTDGDGLDDGAEIEAETNPTEPDTDGDGLNDNLEVNTYGTDPNAIDSDDDGLEDGPEVHTHDTDPADQDTDDDTLADGAEVNTYGTDPTNPDTDGDGLDDGPEVHRYGTNPLTVDSDGDGRPDAAEVSVGPIDRIGRSIEWLIGGVLIVGLVGVALYWTGWLPITPIRRLRGDQPSTDSTGQSAATAGVQSDVPPEFLSDEQRILALLDDNDGQLRQAEIVEETPWSKSKVSRLLSAMEAEGNVVKIDVGRENLVTRPDKLPPGAEPPFEQ